MMPRSKRRRAKRFWHQLRPVCGDAYQQMWMNGGGEGGKIELSLLILPLAYQEENVPSTIAPRQVPVCVCLVLQRFQYLISAEWDRGFVRACFHWNKTKQKKSLDIGDTLNRTLFSAVSMSGNKFYFRPWKRFIYTKLCFLLPKLF